MAILRSTFFARFVSQSSMNNIGTNALVIASNTVANAVQNPSTHNQTNITTITAIAGLFFGLLGAVLGVVNTWKGFSRDRIKVKVRPVWLYGQRDKGLAVEGMGIEITNLSYMAVTITGVGFTTRDSKGNMYVLDGLLGGARFPQRMESRTGITVLVSAAYYEHSNFARVHRAFADTACGKTFKGTSKSLKGQVRRIKEKQHRK